MAHTNIDAYELAMERSLRLVQLRSEALRKERNEAPERLERLAGLSSGGHDLLLRNSPSFQTWGLFEALIETGREEAFVDPSHAEELFKLALKVSSCLDSSFYGRERIEDLRARAWGYIANTRRVRADLQASEEAFEEAFLHLAVGSDDSMEYALLFDLKASLLRYQQKFDESLSHSRRAIATYRRMGETHRVGSSMINLSIAHQHMGNPAEAISTLYQALRLIDRDLDPRLTLCALNNLIGYLVAAERFLEAQSMLIRACPLYQRFREPMVQIRRRWMEAKVAEGLGQLDRAEEFFQQVQAGVFAAGTVFDRSFILSDLASIKARRSGGRTQRGTGFAVV